jgi:hypothetical protein
VQASTPDSTTLTYSATNLPAGLSINATTGVITGTISVGDGILGDDNQGDYAVTISATDGTYTGTATLNWTVSPRIAVSVVDAQQNVATIQLNFEGDSVSLQTQASTPDANATLDYSATDLPPGLSINSTTGTITGTISPGTAKGGDGQGQYTATITVTDGTYTGTATLYWTISPRITVSAVDAQQNLEGDGVSLQVQATTPDNAALTYSATNLPSGLSIDPATGVITGTIATGASTGGDGNGNYTATVTATDGTYTGTVTIAWSVSSPVVASDDAAFYAGVPLDVNVLANDSAPLGGLHVVSFTMGGSGTVAPDSMGGLIYTQTGFSSTGTDTFSYIVADAAGHQATAKVTVYLVPIFAFNDILYTAGPSDTQLTATVVRLGREDVSADVSFRTDDLSAFAGFDYAYTSGTLHFAAGVDSVSFTVSILDHDYFGYRSMHLVLGQPTSGLLMPGIDGAIGEVVGTRLQPMSTDANAPSEPDPGLLNNTASLLQQNLMNNVLSLGLDALRDGAPVTPVAYSNNAAPKPGLFIDGVQIKNQADDKAMISYLMAVPPDAGAFWNDADVKAMRWNLLKGMMSSTTANYSFTSKEVAVSNLNFRLISAHAMARIDGFNHKDFPPIKFGYAASAKDRVIDTTYWTLGADGAYTATTNAQANRWQAITTGLENGKTQLECRAAMQAAYYIGAAHALGETAFNQRFVQPIEIGFGSKSPFLDYSTPWLDPRMADLETSFTTSRNIYLLSIATKGLDPTMATKLDKLRGEIAEIVDKKLITPLTGDQVYFTNSRFYTAIYPEGAWQGENTLAYVDKDGTLAYTGMGTSPKHDGTPQTIDQMKALLTTQINAPTDALKEFKKTLTARQDVKDAATAKGITAAQLVDQVMAAAATNDIGILGFGIAAL